MSESAPKYKLTYFPVMAVGEPIRWLLCYGDLQFEDVRLTPDEWLHHKGVSPFGVVPTFEANGKVMHQSLAICRYLATIVGLSGDNAWENFEIDMAVETINDLRAKISTYNQLSNDSVERIPLKETIMNETLPFYLSRFEEMAAQGYFANGKLSWADIFFTSMIDYMNGVLKEDILEVDKYHILNKINAEVRLIPAIRTWIENRPTSEY